MFDNPEISTDSLPSVGEVTWTSLAGSYVAELILSHVVFLAIVVAAALGANLLGITESGSGFVLPALVYAAIHLTVVLIWAPLSVKRQGYALRDHDLLHRAGVLRRRLTAIPFNRVQHVETASGVLERLFGLATLVVYTAGGSGGDLKIHGLETESADKLRAFILRRAGQLDEPD
ncbi:MAG: PH domain-containing protein [Gammaproteobacteria bacterium]